MLRWSSALFVCTCYVHNRPKYVWCHGSVIFKRNETWIETWIVPNEMPHVSRETILDSLHKTFLTLSSKLPRVSFIVSGTRRHCRQSCVTKSSLWFSRDTSLVLRETGRVSRRGQNSHLFNGNLEVRVETWRLFSAEIKMYFVFEKDGVFIYARTFLSL